MKHCTWNMPTVVSMHHCLVQHCACCFGHVCWRWPSGIQHLTESGPVQGQWRTEPVKWTFCHLCAGFQILQPSRRAQNLKPQEVPTSQALSLLWACSLSYRFIEFSFFASLGNAFPAVGVEPVHYSSKCPGFCPSGLLWGLHPQHNPPNSNLLCLLHLPHHY